MRRLRHGVPSPVCSRINCGNWREPAMTLHCVPVEWLTRNLNWTYLMKLLHHYSNCFLRTIVLAALLTAMFALKAAAVTTSNVVYVTTSGNDMTGTRNMLDLPFLTVSAAKAAMLSGDTMVVYPGEYSGTNVLKDQCKIYLYPGAVLVSSGTNAQPLIDDAGGTPLRGSIEGHGTLKWIAASN